MSGMLHACCQGMLHALLFGQQGGSSHALVATGRRSVLSRAVALLISSSRSARLDPNPYCHADTFRL